MFVQSFLLLQTLYKKLKSKTNISRQYSIQFGTYCIQKRERLFSDFSPNVVAYYPFCINFELKALKRDHLFKKKNQVDLLRLA